ncbi:hypothetical protein Goarm_001220 [Gossypium armourianum]|uniref:Uncharacterized protein n=1 Tax=Gossypium armourianum TaxID=34283 RepID=A0A7J9KCK4_9ROSI|nr:hypothetical protein [Gossypium armourianum]
MTKRRQRLGSQASANGDVLSGKDNTARSLAHSRIEVDGNAENDSMVHPPFEFSTVSPPSIISEGSQGGPWRKKITELDGTEDEKDFPWWVLDCVVNYVVEKMVLDKPIDTGSTDGSLAPGHGGQLQHSAVADGSFKSGLKPWPKPRPSVEILCNNQASKPHVLSTDMSLATVRAYIWKKPEDLVLNYRVVQGR